MEKKPCPVEREELLIALECCSQACILACRRCPYPLDGCAVKLPMDALAYINYLEGQLNAKAGGSD